METYATGRPLTRTSCIHKNSPWNALFKNLINYLHSINRWIDNKQNLPLLTKQYLKSHQFVLINVEKCCSAYNILPSCLRFFFILYLIDRAGLRFIERLFFLLFGEVCYYVTTLMWLSSWEIENVSWISFSKIYQRWKYFIFYLYFLKHKKFCLRRWHLNKLKFQFFYNQILNGIN